MPNINENGVHTSQTCLGKLILVHVNFSTCIIFNTRIQVRYIEMRKMSVLVFNVSYIIIIIGVTLLY